MWSSKASFSSEPRACVILGPAGCVIREGGGCERFRRGGEGRGGKIPASAGSMPTGSIMRSDLMPCSLSLNFFFLLLLGLLDLRRVRFERLSDVVESK